MRFLSFLLCFNHRYHDILIVGHLDEWGRADLRFPGYLGRSFRMKCRSAERIHSNRIRNADQG